MSGKLIWVTGLAGSGKTTISKALVEKLKEKHENVIHLDGDSIREILGNVHGHTIEDRILTAKIYCRLCKFLVEQNMIVVISTISLFHEIHEFNRENVEEFYEILIDIPMEVLEKRNQKKLYTQGKDVMGIHQEPEFPKEPHLVVDNSQEGHIEENVQKILELIGE